MHREIIFISNRSNRLFLVVRFLFCRSLTSANYLRSATWVPKAAMFVSGAQRNAVGMSEIDVMVVAMVTPSRCGTRDRVALRSAPSSPGPVSLRIVIVVISNDRFLSSRVRLGCPEILNSSCYRLTSLYCYVECWEVESSYWIINTIYYSVRFIDNFKM